MERRREVLTTYAAGTVQGIGLVTFPAASAVLTSADAYALSSSEFGFMFLPQVVMAILASLLGTQLSERLGVKPAYLIGLSANLLAMILLLGSSLVMRHHALAYGVLLAATACMGVGFGFTVPALNTLAASFFPKKVDGAVLALNALLGLGTALAPAFIALFVRLGIWWGLPAFVAILLSVLLIIGAGQSFQDEDSRHSHSASGARVRFATRFWIFASFVLLYGICETMNGNWASLYLMHHFQSSNTMASLGLSLFWGMVTAGRVLFAMLEKWFPERLVCRVLPFVVAAAMLICAWAPKGEATLGYFAFALAGLGCSALLPLAISFGQKQLATMGGAVAGGLIAFYQVGYGLAAFGVGPLQTWARLDLAAVYSGTVIIALMLAALSFAITPRNNGAKVAASAP